MTPAQGLTLKGINYDTGTNYMPGYLSREVWNQALIRKEIRAIKDELNCNTINIYGSDSQRMTECARIALECGLAVWLQPRLIDSSPEQMLAHLAEVARAAETLRQRHGNVTLSAGCELSIFMAGIIPRQSFLQRAKWLGSLWWLWMLLPRFNQRLNAHLKKASAVARSHFKGQISYGSGIWEKIDWSAFDLVGLNYYREASNYSSYLSDLRGFQRHRKPIVITEFGCCSFEGADKLGGSGDSIVDYTQLMPRLKGLHTRDERVQANVIVELLKLYEAENLFGAFVFEFTEPSHPYSADPRYDLDMASYGIVKVHPYSDKTPNTEEWEPKLAFHEIAKLYRNL